MSFWKHHPALFTALFFVLGPILYLHPSLSPLLLLVGFVEPSKRWQSIALILGGGLYIALYAHWILLPEQQDTSLIIQPTQIVKQATPFGPKLSLKAKVMQIGEQKQRGILQRISIPLKKRTPSLCHRHQITHVSLKRKRDGTLYAILSPQSEWQQQGPIVSLAWYREFIQKKITKTIRRHYRNPKTKPLLLSLFTGQRDSFYLNALLSEVGLTHLLAISGLHFTCLMSFLLLFTRRIRSKMLFSFLIILLSSLIYCYYGPSPPVTRAYIFFLIYAVGSYLALPATPLNSLGAALLLQIVINPLSIESISLQLSFLATFALLFFTPHVERCLLSYFPDPPFDLNPLSIRQKSASVIRVFFRNLLSVNCAVHLLLAAYLLFLFHHVPLASFYLNLWVPLCIGLSMQLFLIALLIPPLHGLNDKLLYWILYLIEDRNGFFRIHFYATPTPEVLMTVYFLLLYWGLYEYERSRQMIPFRL